jgi:hypothetical protein
MNTGLLALGPLASLWEAICCRLRRPLEDLDLADARWEASVRVHVMDYLTWSCMICGQDRADALVVVTGSSAAAVRPDERAPLRRPPVLLPGRLAAGLVAPAHRALGHVLSRGALRRAVRLRAIIVSAGYHTW